MTDLPQPPTAGAPVGLWTHGSLPRGVQEVIDRWRITPGVQQLAVMPDVHLAGEFCVGMAVASPDMLYPNAVGGDIGCGMLALRFAGDGQSPLDDPDTAARLLGLLAELCPGRRHHRRLAHTLSPDLAQQPMSDPRLDTHKLGEDSRTQLGTLGAGNHFLEFQRQDPSGDLWLMIHTGSRHLGQCVLQHHLPRTRKLATGVLALPADSPEGRAYLQDVALARAWARENRRLLALRAADAAERLLHVTPILDSLVDCDHNHVALESLHSRPAFIHRKGATAAHQGQPGIIPGSMGTRSYHTLGQGLASALHSSSHGAGRALSRTQARDSITISALRQQLRGVWYDARLQRSLREEAPAAYKPIDSVMAAQRPLTAIQRTFQPRLVHKAL